MTHGSLFSGIGGFDLAAQWMGWENVFHCEINPFGRKILKHYWPDAKSYEDITKTDFTIHRGTVDVVSGGFPCQPYSVAGKRKGTADERHLWPEMLRAIREVQPAWIVGENVPGLASWENGMVLKQIKTDLEGEGFEVFPPVVIPACAKDAPHRRDRLWIVAYATMFQRHSKREERQQCRNGGKSCSDFERIISEGITSDTNSGSGETRIEREILEQSDRERKAGGYSFMGDRSHWEGFPFESPVSGGNDGIPYRVDRIKALGNAIVPQVAYEIFKAIDQLS